MALRYRSEKQTVPVKAKPPTKAALHRLSERAFNTPLMIHPLKLQVILQDLGSRMVDDQHLQAALEELNPHANLQTLGQINFRSNTDRRSYAVTETGIAVIPVEGALLKKSSWMTSWSGTCTYEQISEQFADAINDDSIKAVLFDIDSPGGETHGAFELSDLIYNARGSKPIYACANDLAASAAYAIASAADRVYVTVTGAVGSIGVYCLHFDQSALDTKMGVKYTYIYAGERKVDGNEHEPLTKSARSEAQKEIDRQYGMFVGAVARNRGLKMDEVVGTQALCYFADNAIPALADRVGTIEDAVADLEQALNISGTSSVERLSATSTSAATSFTSISQGEPQMAKPVKTKSTTTSSGSTSASVPLVDLSSLDVQIAQQEEQLDALKAQRAASASSASCDTASEPEAATEPATEPIASEHEEPDGDEMPMDDDNDEMKAKAAAAAAATAAIADMNATAPTTKGKKEKMQTPVDNQALTQANANVERASHIRIAELCSIAGRTDLLAGYLMQGSTVDQVIADLQAQRAATSHANQTDSSHAAGAGGAGSSPLDRMEAAARQLMAQNPSMSKAKAYETVMHTQPQLYEEYNDERMTALGSHTTSKKYVAALEQRFRAMNIGTLSA